MNHVCICCLELSSCTNFPRGLNFCQNFLAKNVNLPPSPLVAFTPLLDVSVDAISTPYLFLPHVAGGGGAFSSVKGAKDDSIFFCRVIRNWCPPSFFPLPPQPQSVSCHHSNAKRARSLTRVRKRRLRLQGQEIHRSRFFPGQ